MPLPRCKITFFPSSGISSPNETGAIKPSGLSPCYYPHFYIIYISRSQALVWECMVRGSASGLVLELEAGASQEAFPSWRLKRNKSYCVDIFSSLES